jgi:hypothetical protein
MKTAIGLQNWTRAGRVVRMTTLLALTMALGLYVAVIFAESAKVLSTPTESAAPERHQAPKTGPWHYPPYGARV